MSDATEGYAVEYIPTLAERFWRWAGFHYHLGDEPPDADLLKGWMQTTTGFRFAWSDRLRLLLTGRLVITITSHTDTDTPAVIKNRMDWRILYPNERR